MCSDAVVWNAAASVKVSKLTLEDSVNQHASHINRHEHAIKCRQHIVPRLAKPTKEVQPPA